MLLRHARESVAAFGEGIQAGRVGLGPADEDGDLAAAPACAFRDRAGQLLDAWTSPGRPSRPRGNAGPEGTEFGPTTGVSVVALRLCGAPTTEQTSRQCDQTPFSVSP